MKIFKRLTVTYEKITFFAILPILATNVSVGEPVVFGWGFWMFAVEWRIPNVLPKMNTSKSSFKVKKSKN